MTDHDHTRESPDATSASPDELAEVVTPVHGEQSEPSDDDGQFNTQEMPTTDGEMTDGGSEGTSP